MSVTVETLGGVEGQVLRVKDVGVQERSDKVSEVYTGRTKKNMYKQQ